MTNKRLLSWALSLILLVAIGGLGFSLYHKSRPQTTYLTPPKISLAQIKQQADLVVEAKILKQKNDQLKLKGVTYTAYQVKVTKVPQGSLSQTQLTIYKAGFRDPKSGNYVLYRGDSLPLVNHRYRFYLTKVKGHYLANSPKAMTNLKEN